MAKDPPFHTNHPDYRAAQRNVHHDHNDCREAKRIAVKHRLPGDAKKPRCQECSRLG
jgi:hypothetical protein